MGGDGFTVDQLLAMHNYTALTGRVHSWLPKAVDDGSAELRKQDALDRLRERQRQIDAGEIT